MINNILIEYFKNKTFQNEQHFKDRINITDFFFYPFAPEWLSIGDILSSQAKWCGAGLGFRKNNQVKWGCARGFHTGLVRKLSAERAEVESMGPLRCELLCGSHALGQCRWPVVTGWCNLGFVLGCLASLWTCFLTHLKILRATYYPWLNPFSALTVNLPLLATNKFE